jgi:MSHA biogenesis protein MshI
MPGLFSSKAKRVQIGIDFLPTGVAVVQVSSERKNAGALLHSAFLPAAGAQQQAEALHKWVHDHHLQHAPCNCLLARHDVQLFQLEKPAVTDDELLQAVKWKVKDLISFDVEKSVVDVYELPHSPKTPAEFINAVVANEDTIKHYVEVIRESGLELQVLDIYELATKNFCQLQHDENTTTMILQFSDNESLVTIYHNGDLYVARDLKIGLLDIEAALGQDEDAYDAMLLELQRSMDYFESSYGLGLAQKMLMFPQTAGTNRMASYLQNYVNFDIEFAQIKNAEDAGKAIDTHCFPAYCAALRGVVQ